MLAHETVTEELSESFLGAMFRHALSNKTAIHTFPCIEWNIKEKVGYSLIT